MNYEDAVRATWRHSDLAAPVGSVRPTAHQWRKLVRYATLAPSSHNTQCWRFTVSGDSIRVIPDLSRRLPMVDPDDHHLFVSLGCAAQNLIEAAGAAGFRAQVDPASLSESGLAIALEPSRALSTPSFDAITARQCTRATYDGRPIGNKDLEQLVDAGRGRGVEVLLLTDPIDIERVLQFVTEGNTAQLSDPVFRRELKRWIRFNKTEAVRRGDGLLGQAMGNPPVPSALGRALFGLLVRPGAENDRVAGHIRSSSGIAVFVSRSDDHAHWIQAGRCYQRFALLATSLGIRNAFVNQAVEVADVRRRFADSLGLVERRPDLVVRFGRGPLMPRSLRRPLEAVIGMD